MSAGVPAAAEPRPVGKTGMWIFLVTDAITFAALLGAYAVLRAKSTAWPRPSHVLGLALPAVMTAVLVAASGAMLAALRGRRRALLLAAAGGALFLAGQAAEWTHLVRAGFTLPSGTFPATFFVITGFHGLHVLAGVLLLLLVAARGADRHETAIAGLYFNFVDALWLVIFTAVYLV